MVWIVKGVKRVITQDLRWFLGSMLDLSYAPYIDTSLNIDINSQIPIKQNICKLSVRYKNGVVLN